MSGGHWWLASACEARVQSSWKRGPLLHYFWSDHQTSRSSLLERSLEALHRPAATYLCHEGIRIHVYTSRGIPGSDAISGVQDRNPGVRLFSFRDPESLWSVGDAAPKTPSPGLVFVHAYFQVSLTPPQ